MEPVAHRERSASTPAPALAPWRSPPTLSACIVPPPPRFARLLLLLAAASSLAACASHGRSTSTPPTRLAACAAPDPANPTFGNVSGNHILDTRGRVMTPYGMTIFGLSLQNWRSQTSRDASQIKAAVTLWCTNFIRLQLAPANLLPTKHSVDHAYLGAVEKEISLALSYDEDVILSAQTERYTNQPAANPTPQTVRFWRVLAPLYRDNPRVWFDLFNEPRLQTFTSDPWAVWQYGVTLGSQTYVGMQALVDDVREVAGTANLILVEGPEEDRTLDQVQNHLIEGPNVAYAVHPYNETTETEWNERFGDASNSVPVLADEWVEQADESTRCTTSSASFIPRFFSYLRRKDIGLGAWGLIPGVLVTNTRTFTPTQMRSGSSCRMDGSKAEGAGRLVENYFRRYARR